MKKVIKSFDETPGSSYALYKGQDFHQKFPYLKLQDSVEACYDPTGGVLLADKALRAVQVRLPGDLIKQEKICLIFVGFSSKLWSKDCGWVSC